MKILTSNDIKLGMQVQHTLIGETLTVVPDEVFPYSDKEFSANEIPLSFALMEAANELLTV